MTRTYTAWQERHYLTQLAAHGVSHDAISAIRAAGFSWSELFQLAGLMIKDGPQVFTIATAIATAIKSGQKIDTAFVQGVVTTYGPAVESIVEDVLAVFGKTVAA